MTPSHKRDGNLAASHLVSSQLAGTSQMK